MKSKSQSPSSSLAIQTLKISNPPAARILHKLTKAQTSEDEQIIFENLNNSPQPETIDTQADLAEQIQLEIDTLQFRKQQHMAIYDTEIEKLQRWKNNLDQNILDQHHKGAIGTEIVGHHRRIQIQKNPPAVEIIDSSKIPSKYIVEKTTTKPDKKAIKEALKNGNPVPGTRLICSKKVVYQYAPTTLEKLRQD